MQWLCSDIAQQAEARQVLSSILDYWNGEGIDGATADQQASHSPAGEVEGCDGTTMANLLLTLAYLEFYLDNTPRVSTRYSIPTFLYLVVL